MAGVNQAEFDQATMFFQGINDDDKSTNWGIWQPPTSFNFSDLQGYLDYLPDYDDCAAKLSDEDGCVDSCFLGRNWKNAGGDSLYGGPKLTRPVFFFKDTTTRRLRTNVL
jgi:hypothetical protein